MEIKRFITLLKIEINNKIQLDKLQDVLIGMPYNEENGYGFQDIDKNEKNDLLGTVIKRTPIFISTLDTQSKRIEKVESFVFNEIDFYFDFSTLSNS